MKREPYSTKKAQRLMEHARATGGCEWCLKPHNPAEPSCNDQRCIERWRQINATPPAAVGGQGDKP